MLMLVFSFLLKGVPACEGMRSLYLYNEQNDNNMTDNNIDVNIVPVRNGAKRVVVSYYHYSRKDKNHMSSQTDYVWETKNEEMFKYFEARRTKVFYSQIRAMCRFYGKKNVRKYKKL